MQRRRYLISLRRAMRRSARCQFNRRVLPRAFNYVRIQHHHHQHQQQQQQAGLGGGRRGGELGDDDADIVSPPAKIGFSRARLQHARYDRAAVYSGYRPPPCHNCQSSVLYAHICMQVYHLPGRFVYRLTLP